METINTIKESDILFDFFKKGKIKLRIAKNLFSTSFVAYDVFGKFLTVGKDGHVYNEIKATFYQYKCTESKDEPSIIVNSLHNITWYDFFKNTIKSVSYTHLDVYKRQSLFCANMLFCALISL